MAIKKYKPTTPGRRGMTVTDYSVLSKVEPERSLLEPMKKKGKKWLVTALILVLLAAAAYGASYYYTNHYLVPVESIALTGLSAQERLQMILQDLRCLFKSIFRRNSAVSFNLKRQTVHFGFFTDACRTDLVAHMRHRAEQAVHADRSQRVIRALVALGRTPASAFGNFNLCTERNIFVQRADQLIRIQDFNSAITDDVRCQHRTGFLLADLKCLGLI